METFYCGQMYDVGGKAKAFLFSGNDNSFVSFLFYGKNEEK